MEIRNDIIFAEVERFISQGESVTLRVRGRSMYPLIRDNGVKVILRPVREEDFCIGVVMLFCNNGHYTIHRLRKVEGDSLTFAGDGNYKGVEVVERKEVIAVVSKIIRPSGRVIDCSSRSWKICSALWLAIPVIVRRYILGALRRCGI